MVSKNKPVSFARRRLARERASPPGETAQAPRVAARDLSPRAASSFLTQKPRAPGAAAGRAPQRRDCCTLHDRSSVFVQTHQIDTGTASGSRRRDRLRRTATVGTSPGRPANAATLLHPQRTPVPGAGPRQAQGPGQARRQPRRRRGPRAAAQARVPPRRAQPAPVPARAARAAPRAAARVPAHRVAAAGAGRAPRYRVARRLAPQRAAPRPEAQPAALARRLGAARAARADAAVGDRRRAALQAPQRTLPFVLAGHGIRRINASGGPAGPVRRQHRADHGRGKQEIGESGGLLRRKRDVVSTQRVSSRVFVSHHATAVRRGAKVLSPNPAVRAPQRHRAGVLPSAATEGASSKAPRRRLSAR